MESEQKRTSYLVASYEENVEMLDRLLRVEENFDIIKKPLKVVGICLGRKTAAK